MRGHIGSWNIWSMLQLRCHIQQSFDFLPNAALCGGIASVNIAVNIDILGICQLPLLDVT